MTDHLHQTPMPRIVEPPTERVAVVRCVGDPDLVAEPAIRALLAAVGTLTADYPEFIPGPIRVRWPNAYREPRERWTALWATPVPDGVLRIPQVTPGVNVAVEAWSYGAVVEVLCSGDPHVERPGQEALVRQLIAEQGYALNGPYEDVYLTPLGSTDQRVMVRYALCPRRGY